MVVKRETKACHACARAKRKCGKEVPRCGRCRRQCVDCAYPPSKPTAFVLLDQEDTSPPPCRIVTCRTSLELPYPQDDVYFGIAEAFPLLSCLSLQPRQAAPIDTGLLSVWFNLPSTWQVIPWPSTAIRSFHPSKAKNIISQIQEWYAQWIQTGSNPFIHPELYSHRLPQCVQDAYTALSAYMQRTSDNEHLIFQIFESRLVGLLAEHGVPLCSGGNEHHPYDIPTASDVLSHVARVQTLTTYLIIMLFNGDIHLRYTAERYMSVLDTWVQQMVDAARSNLSQDSLIDPLDSDALWHAWILAESLRRTFVVARTLLAMYEMLKAGKAMPTECKGAMAFTIRKGAWDAQSATEWVDMALEVDFGLMQVGDAKRLVQSGEIRRAEVDSFARTFVEGTWEV